MKKFLFMTFVFLMLALSLVNVVSAGLEYDCDPGTGFDWCYGYAEGAYGNSYCAAEVQGSLPFCVGSKSGNKCAGSWEINIGIGGDKGYIVKSASNWAVHDQCNSNGCPSQYAIKSDSDILQDDIGQPVPKYYLIAWDYDSASDGSWCWAKMGGGYLGDYFSGYEVVECVNNGDCGSGETCSGNVCQQEQCNPDWSCTDWSACSQSGQQTRTCSDSNSCGTDAGKPTTSQSCTYLECQSDNECSTGQVCQNNQCVVGVECNVDADCGNGFICESNECVEIIEPPVPGINWKLVGGIIIAVLLIVAIVVWAITRKKR